MTVDYREWERRSERALAAAKTIEALKKWERLADLSRGVDNYICAESEAAAAKLRGLASDIDAAEQPNEGGLLLSIWILRKRWSASLKPIRGK